MSYYGMGGLPNLVWQGTIQSSGAGSDAATGIPYRATIQGLLGEPSAFKLTVNSVDFTGPTGSIDIDIEVMEGGMDVSNMFLRMVITEDGVSYGGDVYYDVTRDMLVEVPVTVDNLGEIQNVNPTFTVDPSWVEARLEIIAFLQDDTTKKLHASVSSEPAPEYSLRYYALGSTQQVGPSTGFYYFDNFEIFNLGTQTDTYTVDLTGDYPPGWSGGICDDAVCYGITYSTELAPGESTELHLLVLPNGPGSTSMTVEMNQSQVTPEVPRVLKYNYISDDVDVLIVDDDGSATYENYLKDALNGTGYTYGIWDRLTVGPTTSALNNFPAIVWSAGLHYPTLDAGDRAAIGAYLDGGGRLFITGQDIGWELEDQGGTAYQWYRNYLHANFIADDTNNYTLDGVPGDPVSDGIDLVIQGGDGANNSEYPDDIDPADATASVIWSYDANRNGAIRAYTGTYKVVYLAFGFEAIDNALDRQDVMQSSIDWLLAPPVPAGWVPNDTPLLMDVSPFGVFVLSWGASCLASDIDYAIYTGTLGDFSSHEPYICSTDGRNQANVPVGIGDKYYLVVPSSPDAEGSYGTDSDEVQRPASAAACLQQQIGECF
ncbi:MAG: hypothetical protein DRJ50_09230 [Actinobacteria bacterium]|nr:MAG: hypothetical protein DRJ50_09230 [Actinomycetota bacterium]